VLPRTWRRSARRWKNNWPEPPSGIRKSAHRQALRHNDRWMACPIASVLSDAEDSAPRNAAPCIPLPHTTTALAGAWPASLAGFGRPRQASGQCGHEELLCPANYQNQASRFSTRHMAERAPSALRRELKTLSETDASVAWTAVLAATHVIFMPVIAIAVLTGSHIPRRPPPNPPSRLRRRP
jgi:hypothetical protein